MVPWSGDLERVVSSVETNVGFGPVEVLGCGRRVPHRHTHLSSDQLLAPVRDAPFLDHSDVPLGCGVLLVSTRGRGLMDLLLLELELRLLHLLLLMLLLLLLLLLQLLLGQVLPYDDRGWLHVQWRWRRRSVRRGSRGRVAWRVMAVGLQQLLEGTTVPHEVTGLPVAVAVGVIVHVARS